MGWVWRDESEDVYGPSAGGGDVTEPSGGFSGDRCATRKVLRSQCKTEEVEPGKFVKKCEKTEEVLRDCIGNPVEVLHSNKEYTEEDVTDQVLKHVSVPRQFEEGPFNFPGLRSDIEAIEREFFGGIKSFFDAAEEMKRNIFDIFEEHPAAPSIWGGTPIEGRPQVEDNNNNNTRKGFDSPGHVDLSGLARDV